jgi:hypothetical protein
MRSKTRASRRTAQAADVLQVGVEPSSSDCAIAIQDLPIPCFRIVLARNVLSLVIEF